MLEDLYREMDEFGPIPASILLDVATERPDELPWIIESVVNDMTPGLGTDLDSLASVSKLLLERFPEDERGPQMRDEALRIVKGLDARNGNTFQSDAVRQRWGHALSASLSE